MSSVMRRTIDTLLPKGSAWSPKHGGGFDNFLNGLAANWETVRIFLADLKNVRNPAATSFLADLEREYGIPTNLSLTEDQRRATLSPLVYNRSSTGSVDAMQQALTDAGFDVQVYENSPAVDPALFLDQAFQMVADGGAAFAGNEDAFAGRVGGELLVNGDIFKTRKEYEVNAGNLYAGDGQTAGEYTEISREKIEYDIPIDPSDWPLVFFVGGDATRTVPNEVINPGFETGDFSNWSQLNSTIEPVIVKSGSFSSKLVSTGSEIFGSEQFINIDSSKSYDLSAWINVTDLSSGSFRLSLRLWDDLSILQFDNIFLSSTTSGFEQFFKTFGPAGSGADIIIPSATTRLQIVKHFTTSPVGTAYLDDVSLSRSDNLVISNIELANVPSEQENDFKRIILKYKPIHSWAGLIVSYT